jgi:hypothetical protein
VEFWDSFVERFGPVGRDPAAYWSYEIGHVMHLSPDQLGEVTPSDLVGALNLFDVLYRNEG